MGVDIHLYICKDKSYIAENIFEGRNSEWFDNLQQNGDTEYDHLPVNYGISDEAPADYSKFEEYCYGFYFIKVKDFKDWFLKYRPDMDAGWVTKYDAWAYETKYIQPDYLQKKLFKEDVLEDMKFIEVVNRHDCSRWLYDYLCAHNIPDDAIIQYCFDH